MPKVSRSELFGWYIYDWANSAFVTSVVTVFLGPYLSSIGKKVADYNGYLYFFGLPIFSDSLFAYLVSFSVFLQAILLPVFAAVADYSNQKKNFLYLFGLTGSFLGLFLYFLKEDTIFLGSIVFIFANLFFGLSIVMYNSLLNDISDLSERDRISSVGWAFGYLGGGILLLLNLVIYQFHHSFCIDEFLSIRISLFGASFWWLIFTLLSYYQFRTFRPEVAGIEIKEVVKKSLLQIKLTIIKLIKRKNALYFLIAYLFYNDGIQAVIVLSTVFGKRELNLELDFLIMIILIVQFVAFGGSILFAYIAKKFTTKLTITISLLIWSFVIIYAFLFLSTKIEFVFLSILIGMVLGGSQALSRSFYSLLIPKNQEAEYFSFYEISEKGTSWIGPTIFGIALQLTRSYRFAILSLILFFIIGLILIQFVDYHSEEVDEI